MAASRASKSVMALAVLMAPIASAVGAVLTIHEIQSNTIDGDASVYEYDVIDCVGGIVVGKYEGTRPRVVLQDPRYPDGWGGIQVKDWIVSPPEERLFPYVSPGDWVELTSVLAEEFVGNTILQWQKTYNPTFRIIKHDYAMPEPIRVSVSEIPAPLYYEGGPDREEGWYVGDHDAELYEAMRIVVRDVTVAEMNVGKELDNYALETAEGEQCWATDYMNEDVGASDYHPFVRNGQHFCAVSGLFEQYMKESYGADYGWDYYQLVTMRGTDLAICGDGDSDGQVNLHDLPRFVECRIGPRCDDEANGCNVPAWTWDPWELTTEHCLMMDLDYDGDVDLRDFAGLQLAFEPP